MASQQLLTDAIATGAGSAYDTDPNRCGCRKTYQAWGSTTAGSGAATVQVQGSNNAGASWDTIATITLTLGTSVTSDGFTSQDAYKQLRGNVTAISGTNAKVSLCY